MLKNKRFDSFPNTDRYQAKAKYKDMKLSMGIDTKAVSPVQHLSCSFYFVNQSPTIKGQSDIISLSLALFFSS